jgi:hypothetical protein
MQDEESSHPFCFFLLKIIEAQSTERSESLRERETLRQRELRREREMQRTDREGEEDASVLTDAVGIGDRDPRPKAISRKFSEPLNQRACALGLSHLQQLLSPGSPSMR